MPTNQECYDASVIINEAGYQVHPYLVKQIFNRENEKVFASVIEMDGKLGLAVYTPNYDPPLKVVMF